MAIIRPDLTITKRHMAVRQGAQGSGALPVLSVEVVKGLRKLRRNTSGNLLEDVFACQLPLLPDDAGDRGIGRLQDLLLFEELLDTRLQRCRLLQAARFLEDEGLQELCLGLPERGLLEIFGYTLLVLRDGLPPVLVMGD